MGKCNCKIVKTLGKLLLKLALVVLGFFVATFTVYMFNLDMKLMSVIAPLLEKWYDHLEHNQYL